MCVKHTFECVLHVYSPCEEPPRRKWYLYDWIILWDPMKFNEIVSIKSYKIEKRINSDEFRYCRNKIDTEFHIEYRQIPSNHTKNHSLRGLIYPKSVSTMWTIHRSLCQLEYLDLQRVTKITVQCASCRFRGWVIQITT